MPKAKYYVRIGGDILNLSSDLQPADDFPPVVGPGQAPTVIRPLIDIDVTSSEWDSALQDYSPEQRRAAEVRLVEYPAFSRDLGRRT